MLIPSYYPAVGGAERQLYGLLPFLHESGVQPFVLTRHLPRTQVREQIAGVKVVRVWTGNSSLAFAVSALVYLAQHRDAWDLIHVHTADSPALVAATARWLFKKPAIIKVPLSGPSGALARYQQTWWGRHRLRYISNSVDGFVVISKAIGDELLATGVQKHRLFAIPNGVDASQFCPVPSERRKQLREELGLPDSPTAVFLGRLIRRKRLTFLLQIWPELLQLVPGASLLVVGDGPERDSLALAVRRANLQDNIRFVGRCDPEMVVWYLQASDCFVLPSSSEGVSNALLEAMAVGLVPLVSRVDGNLEVINEERNGLVFDTPEELCALLARCFTDNELRRYLGSSARQTVVEHFSMARAASELTALYHDLLRNPDHD